MLIYLNVAGSQYLAAFSIVNSYISFSMNRNNVFSIKVPSLVIVRRPSLGPFVFLF